MELVFTLDNCTYLRTFGIPCSFNHKIWAHFFSANWKWSISLAWTKDIILILLRTLHLKDVTVGSSASTHKNTTFINPVRSENKRSLKCYSGSSPQSKLYLKAQQFTVPLVDICAWRMAGYMFLRGKKEGGQLLSLNTAADTILISIALWGFWFVCLFWLVGFVSNKCINSSLTVTNQKGRVPSALIYYRRWRHTESWSRNIQK